MKADVAQQRLLGELTVLDAEIGRLTHRARNLAEQQRLDEVVTEHRAAADRAAALTIALGDLDGEIARFDAEIDSVRQREDRDRNLLASGTVNAKQLTELQHELETLQRRQASLEDDQLEVMERREELQNQRDDAQRAADELHAAVVTAQVARDQALVEIDDAREVAQRRRAELVTNVSADLVTLYDRQRAGGGPGAGVLQGRRCGACRIEIDRADMARITAAAEDDVLRCPECGAVLLREAR